ncbi:hypothetical protein ABIC63_004490 [Pseudacidovorax sp. 1753]|uniref:DUF4123 domain-containing protein n=1 Tax=unclassified Pseudacidovorax TaxID=2620592 RepID=UPI001B75FB01|nr:DUF4123 domain-containing protein [Pseudacidovorax sp.]MBP6897069.1 DUF4123 domain-containing protein [Pseudacidovorax sp.]
MNATTTSMYRYVLLDGALVHEQLKALAAFAKPGALFEPLMPHPEQHLAGPLLISLDQARADEGVGKQVRAVFGGFGHGLHVAVLTSHLALPELASHLRRAVWFTDDSGESYGLRIADCRVMAYLPGILTPEQWRAVTAPIASWSIGDRQGKRRPLALDAEHTDAFEGLRLTATQIDQLIDAGEPDALLLRMGRAAGQVADPRHHEDFAIAEACVRHWRESGSTDRALLLELARLAFAAGAGSIRNAAWMKQAWQNVVARRR